MYASMSFYSSFELPYKSMTLWFDGCFKMNLDFDLESAVFSYGNRYETSVLFKFLEIGWKLFADDA